MKTPVENQVETVRSIMLAGILAAFVILAICAAAITAERKIGEQCRVTQEFAPCR